MLLNLNSLAFAGENAFRLAELIDQPYVFYKKRFSELIDTFWNEL